MLLCELRIFDFTNNLIVCNAYDYIIVLGILIHFNLKNDIV